jgi:hypothetical protein
MSKIIKDASALENQKNKSKKKASKTPCQYGLQCQDILKCSYYHNNEQLTKAFAAELEKTKLQTAKAIQDGINDYKAATGSASVAFGYVATNPEVDSSRFPRFNTALHNAQFPFNKKDSDDYSA